MGWEDGLLENIVQQYLPRANNHNPAKHNYDTDIVETWQHVLSMMIDRCGYWGVPTKAHTHAKGSAMSGTPT